ncbi:hypothetical protein GCM10010441_49000 [Kitasatospora paracochleata]|uniref:Regulatory protein RecX n=1 Tax=Kitasatospora paracochleata TaxID=58354 RepID=A0ABT1IRQ9_9ACTN|nr:RecX family transcriptional regulator [Kitasatospora paracochleata]MCP2307820.1 regulatory protein [Kitasatospora paracochleata]
MDEPGDIGPPDWFAACAEPDGEPADTRTDGPAGAPGGETDDPAPELPELLRASELPGGRRRRRSALTEERPTGPDPDAPTEPPAPRHRRRTAPAEDGGPVAEPVDPAARARDICLRLLTGAAKTRKQLADALRRREIPDGVAEEVLSRYEEVGLIDDAAFAAAWVEARHTRRGLSRRALGQELRTKGVAGELVERALAQVDSDDETDAARALVERKLRATRGLERETRIRRLVGVLARRGYAEGLAFRVVREALDEEAADEGASGREPEGDEPW